MLKDKKYAVVVMIVGIVAILVIYYLTLKTPIQPMTDQPNLSNQGKSTRMEKPDNTADKITSPQRNEVTSDKAEHPTTSLQTSSTAQTQPSPAPKETEQEKLMCIKALGLFKPRKSEQGYVIDLTSISDEAYAKMKMPGRRKRPYNIVTIYQEYCEEAIKGLEELIRQYPDSAHIQHYQETLAFLKQMLEEDKNFFYDASVGGILVRSPVQDKNDYSREVSPEEIVRTYIHYLRKECLLNKIQGSFKMSFDQQTSGVYPSGDAISFGRRIVLMSNTAVPELVKLLDDRRLIAVDDEINTIPARIYRYQDAAIDILQTMFSSEGNKINPKLPLAQRPFPVEIPEGEYFSEYLEKQTPEVKQKIIDDIKVWVEESKNNPVNPEEPPK